jgi:RNA polymerase sigma-70 factor, ECF subfamily
MIDLDRSRAKTLKQGTDECNYKQPHSGEVPEAETIRRAQRGDAAAFERLYRAHSGRVYALCLRMVGNPNEAEDLTQDAFLRVFRKIHTFRGESAFGTWLHRLALNVVLMELRKKNLEQFSLEETTKAGGENATPRKEFGCPDRLLKGLVERVYLERAVARLSAAYRIVFVLHDVRGYKHREIAEMMDWSVGTSKAVLHRARMRLRELLQANPSSLAMAS